MAKCLVVAKPTQSLYHSLPKRAICSITARGLATSMALRAYGHEEPQALPSSGLPASAWDAVAHSPWEIKDSKITALSVYWHPSLMLQNFPYTYKSSPNRRLQQYEWWEPDGMFKHLLELILHEQLLLRIQQPSSQREYAALVALAFVSFRQMFLFVSLRANTHKAAK